MTPLFSHALRCSGVLLMLLAGTQAQAGLFDDPKDKVEATESAATLPPAPRDDKLLPFYVSPNATLRFMIDPTSLSVADGNTVRFSVVIRSPEGANNVSYEGIRCSGFERKLYATGRSDGSWSPSSSGWRPIADVGANRYHAALAKDFFCEGETVAGKAEAIVERIRRNKPLR